MSISALESTLSAVAWPRPEAGKRMTVEEAASQFEAMMIQQLLRPAMASEDAADKPGETMLDLASQQFSEMLAKQGGMGLAKLVSHNLKQEPVLTGNGGSQPKAGLDAQVLRK